MKQTAIILLGLVSVIFVAKYSARLGEHGVISGVLYVLLFVGVAFAAMYFDSRSNLIATSRYMMLTVGGLTILSLVAVLVLPSGSRVGRLPAIEIWLSDLLAGAFPYHAPNLPSGFPVLFLLALPAYAVGNAGILEAAGIALFGAALLKIERNGTQNHWLPLLLLLLLPSVYYEILVRSELFFNMALVLALIIFTDECLAQKETKWKLAGVAILFGLVLSTRSVVGLAYVIYVLWRFRNDPLRGIGFTAIVVLTFLLTLAPFVLWNPALFFSNGPFSIQIGYLPLWIILLFLGTAAVAGFAVRGLREVIFATGLLLFAMVLTAFLLRVAEAGLHSTLYMDRFDISYFVFCTPFLLFSLQPPGGNSIIALRT